MVRSWVAEEGGPPELIEDAKRLLDRLHFLHRCPDSGDAVVLAGWLRGSPKLAAFVKALRKRIAAKTDARSLVLYPYLWDLEYKVATAADLTRIRKGIERDLQLLGRLHRGDPVVRSTLLEGYKATFNDKARDKLLAEAPAPPAAAAQATLVAEQAPPMVRSWVAEEGGPPELIEDAKRLLDRLHASILRVWKTDLYGPMTDQDGKSWPFDSLKGKTTLINLWYTSCGPCRSEVPYLQKLYGHIKDRRDLQIVTLATDRDASLVKSYLEENKFTFPVLYAWPVQHLADGIIAPSSWIVDAGGVFRVENAGFAGDGEQWIQRTLARMESVSKGGQ
jgi:thiol-disulfide isomerase/thioredoxin